MADKKPPQRLGGLNAGMNSGDGKRLGTLKADGANPSTSGPGSGSGFAARFKPKNFQKVEAAAPVQDPQPSTSAPAPGGRGRGRGRGRGGGGGPSGRGPRPPPTYQSEVVFGGVVGAGGAVKDPAARAKAPAAAGGGGGVKDEPTSPPRARRLVKAGELEAKEEREKRERPPKRTGPVDTAGTDSDSDSSSSSSSDDSASDYDDDYEDETPPMMLAPLTSEVTGPGEAKRLRDELKRAKTGAGPGGGAPPPSLSAVPTELMDRLPECLAALNAELKWLSDRDASEPGLMLFQLPSVLPIPAPAAGGGAAVENGGGGAVENGGGAGPSTGPPPENRPAALSELPAVKIGRLLVMRDGSVAAQIADAYFEVSPGIPCKMHQEFAVVDTISKEVTVLGELSRRVVVTPNVPSLLDGKAPALRWPAAGGAKRAQRAFMVDMDSEEEEEGKGAAAAGGGAANGTETQMEVEAA